METTKQGSRYYADMLDVEEARRLAAMAFASTDRSEAVWLIRESLDLTARVLGE